MRKSFAARQRDLAKDLPQVLTITPVRAFEVIYGFLVDGMLRGAAELRLLGHAGDAEAALSVEKPWQSHGVGTALLERVLLAARNRQVERLHMLCLAENRRMQQLARKFDAALSVEGGSVHGRNESATADTYVRHARARGRRY
jgi:GNAT superfamily N-acetyltransferase